MYLYLSADESTWGDYPGASSGEGWQAPIQSYVIEWSTLQTATTLRTCGSRTPGRLLRAGPQRWDTGDISEERELLECTDWSTSGGPRGTHRWLEPAVTTSPSSKYTAGDGRIAFASGGYHDRWLFWMLDGIQLTLAEAGAPQRVVMHVLFGA
ncbi:MAG: hypothetical protein ACI8S6_000525 [Myxococcota bacterium]